MRRLGALAMLAVVLAGCGGSDSDEGSKTSKAEEALLSRTPKPESVKCTGSDEKADCKVSYADGTTADCFVSASGSARSISCTGGKPTQTTSTAGGAAQWGGAWKTAFGALNVNQEGDRVTGAYEFCKGELEGIVKGRTLTGTWQEDVDCENRRPGAQSTGTFIFTLDAGGTSYRGTWSYKDASKNPQDNTWNGERE